MWYHVAEVSRHKEVTVANVGEGKIEIVPENLIKLDPLTGQPKTAPYTEDTGVQERVNAKVQEQAKQWHEKCECKECECPTKHRFGKLCAACRGGDHWTGLAGILEQITARQEARLIDPAEPDAIEDEATEHYYRQVDEENFDRLAKEDA